MSGLRIRKLVLAVLTLTTLLAPEAVAAGAQTGGSPPATIPQAAGAAQVPGALRKLLDVGGVSTADGALIIQWPANSGTNQQWRPTVAGL